MFKWRIDWVVERFSLPKQEVGNNMYSLLAQNCEVGLDFEVNIFVLGLLWLVVVFLELVFFVYIKERNVFIKRSMMVVWLGFRYNFSYELHAYVENIQ